MLNIYDYQGKEFTCPECGELHRLPIKKVSASPNAISEINQFLQTVPVEGKKVLILCDNITVEIAGNKLEAELKQNYQTKMLVLKPLGYKAVHAEEAYFPSIIEAASDCDFILTVGTGSVTDMGKHSGTVLNIPVVSFPTAPSMNAYTSTVAAYIAGGVKQTNVIKPCVAVTIDKKINAEAPMILIQAGFADSLAKAFANGDWKVNSILAGESYCGLPMKISGNSERMYKDKGDLIQARDLDVIEALMEGLTMGGFSMVLAGKSSPASGGEHLISHSLDMYAHRHHQEVFSYHGIQVGMGYLFTALVSERLRTITSPVLAKIDHEAEIKKYFGDEAPKFTKAYAQKAAAMNEIPAKWEQLHEVVSQIPTYEEMKGYLTKAGCPINFKDINVSEELAHYIVRSARYIRNRITVLDLADELGVLDDIFQQNKYRIL